MRTVFAGLPFYDSLEKVDKNRINSRVPFHSPRYQLPPFLINAETDSPGEITKVELLDCYNVATDITTYFNGATLITGWTNSGYDTFTTVGDDITSLIKTTAGDADYGYTNLFPVISGEIIRVIYSGTLTSGTAPKMVLVNNAGADISNIVTIAAGVNYAIFVATATATEARIRVRSAITEVFEGALTIASSTKTSLPVLYTATANDYFQYKGQQLFTPLPRGQWKVKLTTANGWEYFSESLVVSDIYPNLITGWTNVDYDTFTTSGTTLSSVITDGSAVASGLSNSFPIRKGETYRIRFKAVQNSGTSATIKIVSSGDASNTETIINGINTISLTATKSGTGQISVNNTAAASNWATGELFVNKLYSSRYLRLDFYNSKDLGDILYQDDWAQTVWLETRLNYPTSETVEIGEEKDGIFLTEKLVTKYIYRISTYISRAMHAVLMRLPQHTSIVVTDEVGNIYLPSVGNLQITKMDWSSFETGNIVISFNDGDNSSFGWTYDMDDFS